jgi:TatD DNase family protein
MSSDAHIHPYHLYNLSLGETRIGRTKFNIKSAASAYNKKEFLFNEALSKEKNPFMALCFAVHPQIFCAYPNVNIDELCEFLESLASEKRIHAVGECGFDLFNAAYKETEKMQDKIFSNHLDIALKYNLPIVLHIRRAMHKVFLYKQKLKHLPAVVFHSYSGSFDEAESILRSGINAYFSFGSSIMLNHKKAIKACSKIEGSRLLTETDAPYQPLRGKEFSTWTDIFLILKTLYQLRRDFFCDNSFCSLEEFEASVDNNFNNVFGTQNE